MFDKRRFFIVRTQQAKREQTSGTETIIINGRGVDVTDGNRKFVERMLTNNAEQAFEAAVYRREQPRSHVARAA